MLNLWNNNNKLNYEINLFEKSNSVALIIYRKIEQTFKVKTYYEKKNCY